MQGHLGRTVAKSKGCWVVYRGHWYMRLVAPMSTTQRLGASRVQVVAVTAAARAVAAVVLLKSGREVCLDRLRLVLVLTLRFFGKTLMLG